uniref:Nuclear receptor domain-containing protein n=1 Tax=Caenorhabditis tropicalis TaxID=1561998 RepID=A0A1I7T1M1_9PELO
MDPSSSSTSNCVAVPGIQICEVCGQKAHGKHYGSVSCRACAAFFRRYGVSKSVKPCKKNQKCVLLKNGWFNCKQCRLQKCWDVGMRVEGFQFDRDTEPVMRGIPPTMDTFLGKPNFIIYCAPDRDNYTPKVIIDTQFLVDKAQEVLAKVSSTTYNVIIEYLKGSMTPVFALNPLEKLALGLQQIRSSVKKDVKIIRKFGKEEAFEVFEDEMLKAAKWLTYFDDFQQLPLPLQFDMLKGIWKVWTRLDKLAITAAGRRQMVCSNHQVMAHLNKTQVMADMTKIEIDLSWCTNYTLEQLQFFNHKDDLGRCEIAVEMMLDLQPTDVELSYMMCQLCFHYIGKRYQGVIMDIAERFQESLSNDLHDYYVNRMNMPQYSKRVTQMMKINNHIRTDICLDRSNLELLNVFDVYYAAYSHSFIRDI